MAETHWEYSRKVIEKFGKWLFPELAKREPKFTSLWRLKSTDKRYTDVNDWLLEQSNSPLAQQIVYDNNWLDIEDLDKRMYAIKKWVRKNITYVSDTKSMKMPEYWKTVDETLSSRTGDCEDGSVLMIIFASLAGIPHSQVKLVWGSVIGGGHAYIVYRRRYDAVETVLDWCYWYTDILITAMQWFGLDKKYLDIWGSARLPIEEVNYE